MAFKCEAAIRHRFVVKYTLVNFTFTKSQLTRVSLTSTINYGPRKKEVAEKIRSVDKVDAEKESLALEVIRLQDDLKALRTELAAIPRPAKALQTMESHSMRHASRVPRLARQAKGALEGLRRRSPREEGR